MRRFILAAFGLVFFLQAMALSPAHAASLDVDTPQALTDAINAANANSEDDTPDDTDDGEGNNNGATAVAQEPDIDAFDPAVSKAGTLLPGELGIEGERLAWQVTVTNNGSAPGQDVVFTDTLRDELQIDNLTTDKGSNAIDGQTVAVDIGTLEPGETVNITINTTVLESDVAIDNTGCVESANAETICETAEPQRGVSISELPSTGETPWWRTWLLAAGVAGLALLLGFGAYHLRRA